MVNTHVDNGVGVSSSIKEQDSFLSSLKAHFKIKLQTNQLNYIMLGLSIKIKLNKVKLSIGKYIDDFFQHFEECFDHVLYPTP